MLTFLNYSSRFRGVFTIFTLQTEEIIVQTFNLLAQVRGKLYTAQCFVLTFVIGECR